MKTLSYTRALLAYLLGASVGGINPLAPATPSATIWNRSMRTKRRGTPKEKRLLSSLQAFKNFPFELVVTVDGRRSYIKSTNEKELREIAVNKRPSKAVLLRVNSYGQTISKERLI